MTTDGEMKLNYEEFKELLKPIQDWYVEAMKLALVMADRTTVETIEKMSAHLLAHPAADIYIKYVLIKKAENDHS